MLVKIHIVVGVVTLYSLVVSNLHLDEDTASVFKVEVVGIHPLDCNVSFISLGSGLFHDAVGSQTAWCQTV
jgi:hypothetical protein